MTSSARCFGSFLLSGVTLSTMVLIVEPAGNQAPPAARTPRSDVFLAEYFGLSSSELAAVHRGDIVVTTLPTEDYREVAVVGALRMRVSPRFFVERLRDVADFRRGENVLAVGPFGRPPSRGDLDRFSLDSGDINDLRRCRVGQCQVRFDRGALERIAAEIDWSAADASERARGLVREILWTYLTRYLAEGRAGLPVYQADDEPRSVAEGARLLLDHSPLLTREFGSLRAYLDGVPARPDERAENIFYWSNEVFGLKPVSSLTHTIIWRNGSVLAATVITSQQLYASHYFDASLGVTVLIHDEGEGDVGLIMTYVNRTLGDGLGGWLGGIKRSIARSRARRGLSSTLGRLRQRLEAEYQAQASGL